MTHGTFQYTTYCTLYYTQRVHVHCSFHVKISVVDWLINLVGRGQVRGESSDSCCYLAICGCSLLASNTPKPLTPHMLHNKLLHTGEKLGPGTWLNVHTTNRHIQGKPMCFCRRVGSPSVHGQGEVADMYSDGCSLVVRSSLVSVQLSAERNGDLRTEIVNLD